MKQPNGAMNMNSMSKKLAGVVLGGCALLTAAGISLSQAADDPTAAPPPAGPHAGWHGAHGRHGEIFSKLGLSAEQKDSIKAIMTAARPQMKSLAEQMRANHSKLRQTRPDDPNYGNVVAEVAQSNAALASQRTTQGAELRAKMYAVLTPQQKTQLVALEAARQAEPRHGRWGAPAGGA